MKKTNFQKIAKSTAVLNKTQLTKIKGGTENAGDETGIGSDDVETGITNTDLMGV